VKGRTTVCKVGSARRAPSNPSELQRGDLIGIEQATRHRAAPTLLRQYTKPAVQAVNVPRTQTRCVYRLQRDARIPYFASLLLGLAFR